MTRFFPSLLVALAVVLMFGAAAGADELPGFFIESISIEGTRYSSHAILIAESKLEEGRQYTEPQLRDAVARIKRLPFVLYTDFRLQKGSERGRHVLVITVTETKPLFFSYHSLQEGLDTARITNLVFHEDTGTITYDTERALFRHNEEATTFGGRWFVGGKGMVHGSVENRAGSRFNLGYTQYDVFGTRASISAQIQYKEYSFDFPTAFRAVGEHTTSFNDHLEFDLTAAVPLFGNHALLAHLHRARYPTTQRAEVANSPSGELRVIRLYDDHAELSWLYDTTDDPIFPTRGTLVKAEVDTRKVRRFEPIGPVVPPVNTPSRMSTEWRYDLDARVTRHWSLTRAQSVSAGADVRTFSGNDFQEYALRTRYGLDLWGRDETLRFGNFRFELELERNLLHYGEATSYGTARAGLAFRNAWGIVRLDFRYLGWRHRP